MPVSERFRAALGEANSGRGGACGQGLDEGTADMPLRLGTSSDEPLQRVLEGLKRPDALPHIGKFVLSDTACGRARLTVIEREEGLHIVQGKTERLCSLDEPETGKCSLTVSGDAATRALRHRQQLTPLVVPHGLDIDACGRSELADCHLWHGGLDSVLKYGPRLPLVNPKRNPVASRWTTSGTLVAGAAAAIGASACCAGPLLLVLLGVGGAWGARLVALEVFQPWFIAAALAFFGVAFFRLYRRSAECAHGAACAVPAVQRRQRVLLWLVVLMAVALMAFPLYAPFFY